MRENAQKMLNAKKDEMAEIQKEIKKDQKFNPNTLNQKPSEGEKPKMAMSPLKEGEELTLKGCKNLNIRPKPLKKDSPVAIIDKFDKVEFISSAGKEWMKVKVILDYQNSEHTGYAMSKYLTRAE